MVRGRRVHCWTLGRVETPIGRLFHIGRTIEDVGELLDPAQLEPLRERFAAWQARLADDGLDPAAATAIRMAVDGWWAARLLGLGSPGPDPHDGTRRYLMEAIDRAARG